MKIYNQLSKIKFISKSYSLKFLFIAFLGIHIPLIGLLFFVVLNKFDLPINTILVAALIFTLLATVITLLVLKSLIFPIELVSKSLIDYNQTRKLPNFPTHYSDEVGLLMSNISKSIHAFEAIRLEKEDFTYLLSHDLRNFAGNTQTIAGFMLREERKEYINEFATWISENTSQQLIFIETVINLLKQEDIITRKNHQFEKIDFTEKIVNTVKDRVQYKLMNKNIELETVSNVKECKLVIEPDSLIQVIINLIENSIKFSNGDSKIILEINKVENNLQINVTDFGIGFESEYNEEIFKKFTKKGRVGTEDEPSFGIGLYLCRKIINKYEGELFAYSEGIDKGACFTIHLPWQD